MALIESGVLIEVTNADLQDGVFTIPEGVTSIGWGAFSGCESLISVTIPEGVTSIGRSAFLGCESLISVTILEGVTSIGQSAFLGCESLISVTIPNGVESIEDCAFWGCKSLTCVIIDTESCGKYKSIKGLLASDLQGHVRSKKAYLIGQSVLQDYRAFTSSLFSSQGPLVGHQHLIPMLEDYQNLPENEDYLQLKKILYAETPPLLSDNESAWQMYEDKLSAITSEWKKKYREQCDGFTARDFIKKYIAPTAIKADLLDRLSQGLQRGEIATLNTRDRALLQTLPILLIKIPQWILEKWGVTRRDPAPIALTSVSAVLYSERAANEENASTAQVTPSATNGG